MIANLADAREEISRITLDRDMAIDRFLDFKKEVYEAVTNLSSYMTHKAECKFWNSKAENPHTDCDCAYMEVWNDIMNLTQPVAEDSVDGAAEDLLNEQDAMTGGIRHDNPTIGNKITLSEDSKWAGGMENFHCSYPKED